MRKKKIEKLGHLYATDEMLHMAEQETMVEKKYVWNQTESVFQHEMYVRCSVCEGILIVAVFMTRSLRLEGKKPLYEIFIDKDKEDYLTWDMERKKWRTAQIGSLYFPAYSRYSDIYITPEENKLVSDYLEVKNGVKGIEEYQRSILDKRLQEKHKKETAPWDAAMELVSDTPKDWNRWVSRHGLSEHFIFYDYSKHVKEGYCTWCEKDVPVKKPRHNAYGICLCCGHRIRYKANGRAGRLHTEKEQVYLPQRYGDSLIIRQFSARRYYQNGKYRTPNLVCYETGRVIYDGDLKGTQYYYGRYKNSEYRWIKGYPKYSFFYYQPDYCLNEDGSVYKRTVPALSRRILNRTGLPQLISSGHKISPNEYLYTLAEAPYLERFAKAGLPRLTLDVLAHGIEMEESHSLAKSLGIDGNGLRRLRENDGGLEFLKWLQFEKENQRNIKDSVIRFFEEQEIGLEDIKFVSGSMSELRISNYLKSQYALTSRKPKELVSTWRDYFYMSKQLKRNMKLEIFYKPQNLIESHDEVIQLCEDRDLALRAAEIEKKYPGVEGICQSIKEKYEYGGKKYVIVMPDGIEDIMLDGRALRHCTRYSDIYYERIQRRESFIGFLRKADQPEQAFYTLEFEPDGTVRQKRTVGDKQNADFEQALGFIRRWQRAIRPRLTEEDYRLAKVSARLRVEEFRELQEKNATILHGYLAGKPLADVLEADLMEAALCMEEPELSAAA